MTPHQLQAMTHLHQVAQWLPVAQLVGDGTVQFSRVHTDTRSVQPGDLFVALKGDNFDGNFFLNEARAKGAVAAICSSLEALTASGLSGLVVSETRVALASLATAWRAQFKLPLIAVTGSNGKTTVTQMIASILLSHAPEEMLATEGNFNNDIGVPLTVLRLREHHRFAVVELGMNHVGEIAVLAKMAQPTIALVNNAQREHLEFMATVEAVAHENGAVIQALPAAGVAVFPEGDPFSPLWQRLAGSRASIKFSDAPEQKVDSQSVDVVCNAAEWRENAWHMQVKTPIGLVAFQLRISGRHNVQNALAALACTLAAGIPPSAIVQGLEKFEAVQGRSRAVKGLVGTHSFTLIDDTYNANPDSVKAAIEVLASLPAPRLLVLGDMGEVGNSGPEFHREAGAHSKAAGIEALFCLGTLSTYSSSAFGTGRHFDDVSDLNAALIKVVHNYQSVLVKGSRFMRMERVIQAIQAPSPKQQEPAWH